MLLLFVVAFGCGSGNADKQIERSGRASDECRFVRGTLLGIRSQLWSPDASERQFGEEKFHIQANDWSDAKVCVYNGASIAGNCAQRDQSCMLHVVDWALASVR